MIFISRLPAKNGVLTGRNARFLGGNYETNFWEKSGGRGDCGAVFGESRLHRLFGRRKLRRRKHRKLFCIIEDRGRCTEKIVRNWSHRSNPRQRDDDWQ